MTINVSVQYNGGLLPDIIMLTQCYYHHSLGNPFRCHEDILSLQPTMILPNKRFDMFFPLTRGCSEGLDAFRFFFEQQQQQ